MNMSWHLYNDTIKNSNGELICVLHNSVSPSLAHLIKSTPYIYMLALDFSDFYKTGRKMTKDIYEEFLNVIDISPQELNKWEIDMDGNIVDDKNNPVCFICDTNSGDNLRIKFLPELYKAIKENMPKFDSGDSKQKPLYEAIQSVINRYDSY